MKKQVIVALTLLIAAMFFVASVNLQSQKESLVVEVLSFFNEPIKIDSLKIGNLAVQSGEKFVATEDWLKELSVNIKNSFGKTVTYIDVGVFVGRPKGQEEVPMFHYSILRGSKINALKWINSGLEFKSSDSIESNLNIAISDKEYKEIQESLNQLNYPSKIEKLQIQIEEVVFEDGTMWSSGSWYKYNPDDPKNPIRINGNKGGENEIATLPYNRTSVLSRN